MIGIESAFNDPEVKRHLISVLESDLAPEQKYSAIAEFFALVRKIETKVLTAASERMESGVIDDVEALSTAADDASRERLEVPLKLTEDAARRAIGRIQRCQHDDGSWGYQPEQSDVWGTAHALLALWESRALPLAASVDARGGDQFLGQSIERGIGWMKDHATQWSAMDVPSGGVHRTYDASIAVICLCRLGFADFSPVRDTLDQFAACQNYDGGFEANLYRSNLTGQGHLWSQAGATSMVMQALVEALSDKGRSVIRRGADWLIRQQNDDGSWNDGSCGPGRTGLDGKPRITKTCDAIKALLAAAKAGLPPNETALDKAVKWVLEQEKIISATDGSVDGWGYSGGGPPELPDLELTCLVLETLLKVNSVPLAHLTANAIRLVRGQHQEDTSTDDGKWVSGDTFRISLSLIQFYQKISQSSALLSRIDK